VTYRNRYENKFLVPEAVAQNVLQRVQPFVAPDPNGAHRQDHSYPICSLYLDDSQHSLYRETVEGLPFRYKLRVRAYDDAPDSPLFLEIKRRHDRVVQKLRCRIPRALLSRVITGEAVALPDPTQDRLASLAEFTRLVMLRRAVPTMLVRYQRQAYVGLDDPEVRVTADRRLCALPMREPLVTMQGPFVAVPTRHVVLELKFTDRMPPWMAAAIRDRELHRRSYSKYCNSLDALRSFGAAAS
jgi:VTC domain